MSQDRLDRVGLILPYLSEKPQKQKLLTFLKDTNNVSSEVIEQLLPIEPALVFLDEKDSKGKVQHALALGRMNFFYNDKKRAPPRQIQMQSLGKGQYLIPAMYFSETILLPTERVSDSKTGMSFQKLPNGLFMRLDSHVQDGTKMNFLVEVRPNALFPPFHTTCASTCTVSDLLKPYPADLCKLMKQEILRRSSPPPTNLPPISTTLEHKDVCLQLLLNEQQMTTALTQTEQYGYIFSESYVQVEELFEKVTNDSLPPRLTIHTYVCLSDRIDHVTQAIQEIVQQQDRKTGPFDCCVYVLVIFSKLVATPSSCVDSLLEIPKEIKIVIVELKREDFEGWCQKRDKCTEKLQTMTLQL